MRLCCSSTVHHLLFWIQTIDPEFVSVGADSGKNGLCEPSSEKLKELLECLEKLTEVRKKKNLERILSVVEGRENHR